MKDCAHHSWLDLWRSRLLAFFGAAVFGLLAPTGCVVAPDGWHDCGCCEPSCGAPCDSQAACEACESCDCPPCEGGSECGPIGHHRKLHLPHCRLYNPEAGIFNFCIPPQCIQEPPPLPPGRFFPVPVRPAFAPRQLSTYAPPGAW